MASINHLPVELLDHIASLSRPEESMALTFVCRVFNAVATRYAYRHVLLPNRHQGPHSIRLFLRTLLDKPNVGAYVRTLVVHVTDYLDESRLNEPERPNTPADLYRLARDATSRRLSDISNAILHGSIGAMLLLLFCHLPALRSLEMNPLISYNHLFFRRIHWQENPTFFPALRSLRSVDLSHWNTTSSFHALLSFLLLPRISSIYCLDAVIDNRGLNDIHDDSDDSDDDSGGNDSTDDNSDNSDHDDSDNGDDDDEDDEDDTDYSDNDNDGDNNGDSNGGENNDNSSNRSGVEVIQLEGCVVATDVLCTIVKTTLRLRSLIYRHDETRDGIVFFGRPLGCALRANAQDTLENLELDFSIDDMCFLEAPGALGSLRDFTRLKHITAPMSVLLDEPSPEVELEFRAILPPSLISLSLWIDPNWEEAGWELTVILLLQTKQEIVPLLERLHIGGEFDVDLEEDVREACDQAQVDVSFLNRSQESDSEMEDTESSFSMSVSPTPEPSELPDDATSMAISGSTFAAPDPSRH